jgi:phage shock protein A
MALKLDKLESKIDDNERKSESKIDDMESKIDDVERKADEQREVDEEEHVSSALEQMDSLWWQMRVQFDRYLDAADGQVKTFKAALKALHTYIECTTNFAGIKDAYAASARVERQTHAVLKEVWMTVLPLVGELAAKIEDSAYLLLFAQADVRAVDLGEHFRLNTSTGREQFCTDREKQKAVVDKVARAAARKGLYGQAVQQLKVTLGHLLMLEDRYASSGIGKAPDAEAALEAAKRIGTAQQSVTEAMPALTEWLFKRAAGVCDN